MSLNVLAVILFTLLGFTYQGKSFLDATTTAILVPTFALVILIIAVYIKKTKLGEMDNLSIEDFKKIFWIIAIAGINIMLIASTGAIDLTTLSILFPSYVLFALVLEAAKRKGLAIAIPLSLDCFFKYFLVIVFAGFSLIAINCNLHWTIFPQITDSSILAAITFSGNVTLTVLLTAVITLVSTLFFSKGQCEATSAILHTSLLCFSLFYLLPVCFLLLAHDSSVDMYLALKDIYRVCIALSAIPASLMGFAVAFHGAKFAPFSTQKSKSLQTNC